MARKSQLQAGAAQGEQFQDQAIVDDALTLKQKADFFKKEYHLNHLIGTYKKPIISLLDGITMGGGAGLSVHGSFRIATESTVFAMPETAIGFFPDVGGSFFLSRLEGALGSFLALTGFRLKGADTYHTGIATHYIPAQSIDHMVESLANLDQGADHIDTYLEQFSAEALPPFSLTLQQVQIVEECFSKATVPEIMQSLDVLAKNKQDGWCAEILALLHTMSPTSLAVTLSLLQRAKGATFKGCLSMEYELAKKFISSVPDMREGVAAKLIRKEKVASWNPASLDKVSMQFVSSLFQSSSDIDRLEFSNDTDFEDYPHRDNALPSVERLKQLTWENRHVQSRQVLIKKLLDAGHHKLGLAEKLQTRISAHVRTRKEVESDGRTAASNLTWID